MPRLGVRRREGRRLERRRRRAKRRRDRAGRADRAFVSSRHRIHAVFVRFVRRVAHRRSTVALRAMCRFRPVRRVSPRRLRRCLRPRVLALRVASDDTVRVWAGRVRAKSHAAHRHRGRTRRHRRGGRARERERLDDDDGDGRFATLVAAVPGATFSGVGSRLRGRRRVWTRARHRDAGAVFRPPPTTRLCPVVRRGDGARRRLRGGGCGVDVCVATRGRVRLGTTSPPPLAPLGAFGDARGGERGRRRVRCPRAGRRLRVASSRRRRSRARVVDVVAASRTPRESRAKNVGRRAVGRFHRRRRGRHRRGGIRVGRHRERGGRTGRPGIRRAPRPGPAFRSPASDGVDGCRIAPPRDSRRGDASARHTRREGEGKGERHGEGRSSFPLPLFLLFFFVAHRPGGSVVHPLAARWFSTVNTKSTGRSTRRRRRRFRESRASRRARRDASRRVDANARRRVGGSSSREILRASSRGAKITSRGGWFARCVPRRARRRRARGRVRPS